MDFGIDMPKELVKRTVLNLQFLEATLQERQAAGGTAPIFEVTQLINSMLGAIIAPYESDRFREADVARHWEILWNASPLKDRPLRPLRSLRSIARMSQFLRNAFAHGNFRFIGHDGAITEIELWTDQVRPMRIEIQDLRTLTLSLAALILSDGATTVLHPGALKSDANW